MSFRGIPVRPLASLATLVVLSVAAFPAGRAASRLLDERSARVNPQPSSLPRPGTQLIAVYVGSSRCGPSNQTDVLSAVRTAIDSLRGLAAREGVGFVTIGVAREHSPREGLRHLEKVTSFDEVTAGQGDLNQASIRLISLDHPGIGATPQLIVLRRELAPLGQTIDNVRFEEHVLLRRVGSAQIRRWVDNGVPVPTRSLNKRRTI
jgi:hypothetical protein